MDSTPHQSVLYKEIIHALQPVKGGRYVDGTLGAGGHARGIMEASAPDGQLLGLDVDPQALAIARKTLAPYEHRTHLVQASYASLSNQLAQLGWNAVDGILLDLGASSMGDTGSLALGSTLAVVALMTGQWPLLLVIGIIPLSEALSVVIQVTYFKMTRGKRFFKMTPIHLHFELLGWSETQVVQRFWLIGLLAAMVGLGLAVV